MPRRSLLTGALALALLSCGLSAPAPASAADSMLSMMQDDNALIYGNYKRRDQALDLMKTLGVDAVRVTVLWEAVAPKRPINGSSVKAYGANAWDRYDGIVRAALARGMIPYFNVTSPGPRWAQEKAPRGAVKRTWKPDPQQFGRFVKAVGKRYGGKYRDENEGRKTIPRVSFWGIGNEPNQGGWLEPQTDVVKGAGRTPLSPSIYRDLLVQGADGLLRTGHQQDLVLFGETAPTGVAPLSRTRPLRPALFLRELFCLNKGMRRYSGKKAEARNCKSVRKLGILKRFPKLSYAHHPYTKTLPPLKRDRSPDSLTMANIDKLPALLDNIAGRTKLIPANLPILLTEFGYETSPPDPFNGIKPELQAQYINQGDYLAFKQPRIFATTQFQLFDVAPQTQYKKDTRLYWFTYQSGIYTDTGAPKPAAPAYALPFDIEPAGGGMSEFWGQVRFTPNATTQTVQVQRKVSGVFQDFGPPITVTNPVGMFSFKTKAAPGSMYRAVWTSQDQTAVAVSRDVRAP